MVHGRAQHAPSAIRVAVIGSGIAGILTGIELRARGLTDFVILEKADTLGGTWRDNVYPGVACDVPAHLYSFSFAPNTSPTRRFASGPELWDYFRRIADSYGVSDHIRYGTEIVDAVWNGSRWTLTAADGEAFVADVVVSAVGRLQQPSWPDMPGADFRGRVFHSARWEPDVEIDGARVGVVGTGSSATQMTVAMASRVAHLDLFQRTAQWIFPMDNTPIPWWRRTLMRLIPAYARRYRAGIKRWVDEIGRAAAGEPQAAEERRQACVDHLDTVRDPELRAKLTPDYEVGCKRLVISGEFYDAVQRENVDVVTTGITRIEPDGVRTDDGVLHPLDVLVLATGFHADAYLRPMTVTGEDGVGLDDIWAEVPMNYKSVALPHMPNFFMINGPFSPGGSASVLSIIEIHVGYVMQLIDRVIDDRVAVAPDPRRSAELLTEIRERASKTVWGTGGCTSWYLDRHGVPLVNPVLLDDLAADMAHPDFADFQVTTR